MVQERRPALVVFSGLPGTGKTTVAKALAAELRAVYLRIDAIEQAMKAAGTERIGPAGYGVACAVAEANLLLGHWIIADCVDPVRASRQQWASVAARAGAALANINLVCSDPAEHRRRMEQRSADIAGHRLPTWEVVQAWPFEPRDDVHLKLDGALATPGELVNRCVDYLSDLIPTS